MLDQVLPPGADRLTLTAPAGYCGGLIIGLRGMLDLNNRFIQQPEALCVNIPKGVSNGQLARVIITYVEAHPSRMHEDFALLSYEALRAAWPCPSK
jgi:hypothetical protein